MKHIKLTRGMVTIVDNADFEELSRYKWHANSTGPGRFYAARCVNSHGKVSMAHQLISILPGFMVDHINGDTLDNRKSNLRCVTPTQNAQNARAKSRGKSVYKGVTWDKCTGKWVVRIWFMGKRLYLGRFDSELVAARVYIEAEQKYFGRYASSRRKNA